MLSTSCGAAGAIDQSVERFDYIVVGAGSAGCIVAAELSNDPTLRVLLLECGDPAEAHPETLSADGYKDAFRNDKLIWERFSSPQPECGGRRLFMGSGRGMGGSGSVNSMVYTRGDARDYEAWPAGWRWTDVVPAFEAVERRLRLHRHNPTLWTDTCVRAATQAGFRYVEDLNGGDLEGAFGYEWMNYEADTRRSSYAAFIRDEAKSRPNLVIKTRAHACRIRLNGERRTDGVEYDDGNTPRMARVTREVILAAGALETPKLLMLSGLGPEDQLRAHGIRVAVPLSTVGSNFHDHPNATLFFLGRPEVDCNYPQLYGFHRAGASLPEGQSDTCYVMYPARSSLHQALVRMLPTLILPGRLYQMKLARRSVRMAVDGAFRSKRLRALVARIYGIVVILGKPRSRGRVSLASSDPRAELRIDPAYFDDPNDLRTMISALALARGIVYAEPLQRWGNRELSPGSRSHTPKRTESWLRRNVMTTYHFAGTCRMGEDLASVVDTRLRVRGVRGLRIADAAAIPCAPVAALNAPTMMLAWRAARFILEELRSPEAWRRAT